MKEVNIMLELVTICPHPPLIIPEVGQGELHKVEKTVQAMEELAQVVKNIEPEIVIFITPHGPVFQDAITISHPAKLRGSLSRFGVPLSLEREFPNDFSQKLLENSRKIKAMVAELDESDAKNYGLDLQLDHGILVPLYYLNQAGVKAPILPVNMGLLPLEELYEFGIILRETIEVENIKAVLVISGDLSHRLTPEAPAGFDPQGKVFDEILVQAISEGDVIRVLSIDNELVNKAGECGLRPIIMGLGVFDGYEIKTKIYSYEGPFGVGYLVAELESGQVMETRKLQGKIQDLELEKIKEAQAKESWPVKWARENLESYLEKGDLLPVPDKVPEEFKRSAGVFVSLKKQGQLRGCIGTINPTRETIIAEIQANVLKAALEDPRFEPVDKDELVRLSYSVDILEKPEKVRSIEELDPQTYGVIVRKGYRQGLLLPMLEGIETIEEQLAIAKQKAGIALDEEVELEKFKVTRYL